MALGWYAVVAAGGGCVLGLLRRGGVGAGASWAVARIVAWVVAGWFGWIAGWLGVGRWWWVGAAALVAAAVAGRRSWRRTDLLPALEPELVGLAVFAAVALLRLGQMNVSGTEKPMDLAILAVLMRPGGFPPADPWLAGAALPYYYWGALPWAMPARLLGLFPDVAYNLIVPTVAAVSAQAAWALARALNGSRRTGVAAAFLAVFAGTPDGWRQLLATGSLLRQDLWSSSRQISGAITEFPLFSFQLGDLHPHLLAVPLILAALFAARAASRPRAGTRAVAVTALLYGAAAAANPWSALPVGAGVLLLMAGREEGFMWPRAGGGRAWWRALAAGGGGWLLFAPFWLEFHPPLAGIGVVGTPTRWDQLALFLGAVLLPPILVSWELSWRWGGLGAARRQVWRAGWLASVVVLAAVSGSVGLALAVGLGAIFTAGVLTGGRRLARPAWALTLVPLGLLGVMELVYLRDPYGGELYRMNTVFKASHLAFTLLAVLAPVLLGWLHRRRPGLAAAGAAVVLAAGLPQLAATAARVSGPPGPGWGGLAWMQPCDAAMAHWMYRRPAGSTLVEGLGEAYTDAARISAASGVPAALGWENHERVWRGAAVMAELVRRRRLVEELYSCGRPERVAAIAEELGAGYIVVGPLERRNYPAEGVRAVESAGTVVFSAGECRVVEVHG